MISAVSGMNNKLLTIELRNAWQLFGNWQETSMMPTSDIIS
jgi:hypothetical protein